MRPVKGKEDPKVPNNSDEDEPSTSRTGRSRVIVSQAPPRREPQPSTSRQSPPPPPGRSLSPASTSRLSGIQIRQEEGRLAPYSSRFPKLREPFQPRLTRNQPPSDSQKQDDSKDSEPKDDQKDSEPKDDQKDSEQKTDIDKDSEEQSDNEKDSSQDNTSETASPRSLSGPEAVLAKRKAIKAKKLREEEIIRRLNMSTTNVFEFPSGSELKKSRLEATRAFVTSVGGPQDAPQPSTSREGRDLPPRRQPQAERQDIQIEEVQEILNRMGFGNLNEIEGQGDARPVEYLLFEPQVQLPPPQIALQRLEAFQELRRLVVLHHDHFEQRRRAAAEEVEEDAPEVEGGEAAEAAAIGPRCGAGDFIGIHEEPAPAPQRQNIGQGDEPEEPPAPLPFDPNDEFNRNAEAHGYRQVYRVPIGENRIYMAVRNLRANEGEPIYHGFVVDNNNRLIDSDESSDDSDEQPASESSDIDRIEQEEELREEEKTESEDVKETEDEDNVFTSSSSNIESPGTDEGTVHIEKLKIVEMISATVQVGNCVSEAMQTEDNPPEDVAVQTEPEDNHFILDAIDRSVWGSSNQQATNENWSERNPLQRTSCLALRRQDFSKIDELRAAFQSLRDENAHVMYQEEQFYDMSQASSARTEDETSSPTDDELSTQTEDELSTQMEDESSAQTEGQSSTQTEDQSSAQTEDQFSAKTEDLLLALSDDDLTTQSEDQSTTQSENLSSAQTEGQSSAQTEDQSSGQTEDDSDRQYETDEETLKPDDDDDDVSTSDLLEDLTEKDETSEDTDKTD